MTILEQLTESIKKGNRNEAKRLTQEAINASTGARQILDALIAGMDHVGRRFQCNEIFVPEMLIASRAMKEAMGLLEQSYGLDALAYAENAAMFSGRVSRGISQPAPTTNLGPAWR